MMHCNTCNKDTYPTQAMQADMTFRPQCPCGAVYPAGAAVVVPESPKPSHVSAPRVAAPAVAAPLDILTAARARRSAIDLELAEHDALIVERARLDRMIRAAERTPKRRSKAPTLRLAAAR